MLLLSTRLETSSHTGFLKKLKDKHFLLPSCLAEKQTMEGEREAKSGSRNNEMTFYISVLGQADMIKD